MVGILMLNEVDAVGDDDDDDDDVVVVSPAVET